MWVCHMSVMCCSVCTLPSLAGQSTSQKHGRALQCRPQASMSHSLLNATSPHSSLQIGNMHLCLQRASGSSGSKRCAYLGVNCPVAAETDSVGGRIVSLQRLQPEHHLGQCCPFLHDSQCFVHEQNFVFIQRGSMNWYSQQHICSTP